MSRKLASVVIVDDIKVHPNADALELAIVGGWQCCVKKGEFVKGQTALYCEIDAMLPLEGGIPEFGFLEERKESLKKVDEKNYSRIKTIKLRKELSQGLLIPLPAKVAKAKVGDDLTEKLGVLKYEKPEAGVSVGTGKGGKVTAFDKFVAKVRGKSAAQLKAWPDFIQKTDQERVQNKTVAYGMSVEEGEEFEITYKLDGSSFTAFIKQQKDGSLRTGVCSRNYELQSADIVWTKQQQIRQFVADFLQFNRRFYKNWKLRMPEFKTGIAVSEDNFVKIFRKYDLDAQLRNFRLKYGYDIAIQGEMIGPSIQAGFEGNPELDMYVYNVYIINTKGQGSGYMLPEQARGVVAELGLKYVPMFEPKSKLLPTVQECLAQAEGGPAFKTGKYREGLVYKSLARDFSFKAISNHYLIKNDG